MTKKTEIETEIGSGSESRIRAVAALAMPVLLVLPSFASDTLRVPTHRAPLTIPCVKIRAGDESCFRPEADHPAEGEGSGELPTFVGIGAPSGNTTSVLVTQSWEPANIGGGSNPIFERPSHMLLNVGRVTLRRPMFMPRIRSGLKG